MPRLASVRLVGLAACKTLANMGGKTHTHDYEDWKLETGRTRQTGISKLGKLDVLETGRKKLGELGRVTMTHGLSPTHRDGSFPYVITELSHQRAARPQRALASR